MKLLNSRFLIILLAPLSVILASCGNGASGSGGRNTIEVVKKPGFNQNHGPFDSRGNYREEWADNPPRRVFVSPTDVNKPTGIPTQVAYVPPVELPPVVQNKPRPTQSRPTYVAPKPKPKPIYVKPKPKRKAPIVHTVKTGDTLYGLSLRYKSGVKTIQIANGLKGTTIRIGQKLKIPRY